MLTFVHLSDLHIGQDGEAAVDRDSDPREELIADAKRVAEELGTDVTGVLISGDIAYSGEADQYDRAREWLGRLCRELGTAEENVWTVPGNHDFRRSARTDLWHGACDQLRGCEPTEIDAYLRPYLNSVDREVLLEPLLGYHGLATGFECVPEGPIQVWDVEFELTDELSLQIVGLNTAILADGAETATGDALVLGENAMQRVRGPENAYVLAIWHHPLNWLRDGAMARDYLDARACVHIFGHEHSHCLSFKQGRLSVSAGALHPRRGCREWEPRYNFLQLSAAGANLSDGLDVTVMPRVWDQGATTFTGEGGTPDIERHEFLVGADRVPDESEALIDPGEEDHEPPVNASAESYEPVEQQPTGRLANRRRRLALRYANLPFVRRIVIAGQLGLLEEADRDVSGFEQTRLVLERAAAEDRLAELWDAVATELDDDQMRVNPYTKAAP